MILTVIIHGVPHTLIKQDNLLIDTLTGDSYLQYDSLILNTRTGETIIIGK